LSALDDIIDVLNKQGWRVHSLYQGESQWEARIKLASSGTVYGNGEGPTPFDALSSALASGEARLKWRPAPTAARTPPSGTGTRTRSTTTDDLLGGLDL
jgi:hypothetical protein